jgi:UDP-N-acetylmuramyl pentapeptide phosphotransferase/UDP-N-acetylglucosamine-1-phosphate transferase
MALTNVWNFMDGIDGIAATQALLCALAIGFLHPGIWSWWAFALAAATLGFLPFNFPKARIFLGDVGSIPLGFLAAALGIAGWRNDVWPLWFPVLGFGPFIGDATITLLKRALRGERVWLAHRTHYYQRMVQMGFGHRGTAWGGYALMAGCAGAALAGRDQAPWMQGLVFFGAVAVLGALAVWIDVRWARNTRAPTEPA